MVEIIPKLKVVSRRIMNMGGEALIDQMELRDCEASIKTYVEVVVSDTKE